MKKGSGKKDGIGVFFMNLKLFKNVGVSDISVVGLVVIRVIFFLWGYFFLCCYILGSLLFGFFFFIWLESFGLYDSGFVGCRE